MARTRRIVMASGALAAAFLFGSRTAHAKPEWTKPYLELPTPQGPYIARNDAWVIVREEIELALTEDLRIETRYRILYEHLSDRPEMFTTRIRCDEDLFELVDPTLYVQRTLWHRINLTKKADRLSFKDVAQVVFASAEDIEPNKKIYLEYTLRDRLGVTPWSYLPVPEAEPAQKIRYMVDPDSARRGLVLELRRPAGEPMPANFIQESDGSWTVSDVPAYRRITTKDLIYQPEFPELFPYFLARSSKSPSDGAAGFVKAYLVRWNERLAAIDKAEVQRRVQAIVGSATSTDEKAARLAGFAQHDIQYDDSNEFALETWVPIKTQDTLLSMKADCKGKALLLAALLQSIGIASAPVLLHAGRGYTEGDAQPGSMFLNHAILAVAMPAEEKFPSTLVDGPGKGMVLFDPTRETAAFGQPLPGYEGRPALFIAEGGDPRFTIHTATPAAATVKVRIDQRLGGDGTATFAVKATDNGGSPILSSLMLGGTAAQHKEFIVRAVDDLLPRARVTRETGSLAAVHPPGTGSVEIDIVQPGSLQELGRTSLLANPMGVAALLAGFPTGLKPADPPRPDDAVTLAAPWDTKLSARGELTVVELQAKLELPASLTWSPPPKRTLERPWIRIDEEWTAMPENVYEGKVRLEFPRGLWGKDDRRARLKVMDDLYTGFSSPLLLEKPSPK